MVEVPTVARVLLFVVAAFLAVAVLDAHAAPILAQLPQ